MKKKFFTLFSSSLVILALVFLSSCSGITSPSEPEAATAHQAEGLSLRGTFSLANATAEPSLNSSSQGQSQRNAIPTIGTLTYSVQAFRQSDGATKWADVDQDTKSYEFRNTLSSGTWQITAYAKQGDITILQSETTTITLSKNRPDASANLALAPSTEGSGDIALTIAWDSNTKIGWVQYNCPALSPSENSTTGSVNSFTLEANNVATGIYPLTISFYINNSSSTPLYSCTEYIAVYQRLTTDTWTKSTAPHISSSGTFNITADCVKTFVYRSVYLSSSGNDDTANGTSERPYKTVKKAMERLTELATNSVLTTSEDSPWELHVIGEIKANSNTDLASSSWFVNVSGLSIQHLAIIGEGSGAIINANEKAPVLHVCSGANVSMENITLTKGSGVSGGGVAIDDTGTTFTIKSGSITGNKATSFGGGVYIGNGATLNMSGGSITGNESSDKGGGIYAYGSFTGTSTTIKTNTASTCGNNIFINSTCPSTVPDGDNAFYNDTTSTNGKADAVCLIDTKQFARFNNPSSGTTDFNGLVKTGNGIFDTSKATTLYIGNSNDSTVKTWKASETIIPAGVVTIESSSSKKHTISSSTGVNTNLVNASKSLTLKTIILQGNSSVRCIAFSAGTLTLENSTLTGIAGSAANNKGAGLYLISGSATIDEDSTIESCDNASAENDDLKKGGGIYIEGSSTSLTLYGVIKNCRAAKGGGIYMENGTVTLKGNALIGQNESGSNYPTSIGDGSNKATVFGAGVYIQDGTFKMEGSSKISYNYANNSSGGIYMEAGTANIGSSSYTSPSVCNNGSDTGKTGGIYIAGSGTVYLYGSAKANSLYDVGIGDGCELHMEGSAIAQKVSTHMGGAKIFAKNLTATTAATITPASNNYITTYQVIYPEDSSNLAAACAKFAIADDAEGRKWTVNTNGYLSRVSNLLQSSSKMVITDPTEQYIISSSSSGQIDINQNVATTPSLPYEITLRDLTRDAGTWESALILYNDDVNTPLSVKINLEGNNSLIGYNHGGIKLWAENATSTKTINLEFTTESSATLTFDAKYSSTPSLDIRDVINANLSISSGCSFTGTIGGTSYTNSTAFFNAAKTTTQTCTFTITRP
ncbi:MAG: hypothetical protein IIU30_01570 [Treponema sp.]|nr:hypothetical protein [Treponema sp.]